LIFDIFRREDGLVKRKIGHHVMYLDPKDQGISKTLRRLNATDQMREPAFMYIIEKEAEKGMVALDLGANIGYVTLILAEIVGDAGQVYALEPDPNNFRILNRNINANGYNQFVYPFNLGGSNITGNMLFYSSDSSNLGGMSKTEHTSDAIDVAVTTMDKFFENKPAPNFIKMDIEGHEVEVFKGMYQTLKRAAFPVKILMEVHPMFYSDSHSLEVELKRLLDIGFKSKYVVTAGVAKPDFFAEHGYEPKKVFNVGLMQRGLYTDISNEHMLIAACREHKQLIKSYNKYVNKIVRAIMIEKN